MSEGLPSLQQSLTMNELKTGEIYDEDEGGKDSPKEICARQNSAGSDTPAEAADDGLAHPLEEDCIKTMLHLGLRHLGGFITFFGSGLLASVAYLDPGNLEADIQLGVASGMSLLWWTAICCLVFGFTFQNLSGRVGLVTGKDLAQHLGQRYNKPARVGLWLLIEIAIIGADIQETIGSAIGIAILSNGKIPLYGGCILVSATAFSLLLLERVGFRWIEMLFAAFLSVEAVCMGINFFQAPIAAVDVAKGVFIPKLSTATVPVAMGALGALVMPYNIYFQSAVVNSRPRDVDTDVKKRTLLAYLRVENFLVLVMAFIINLFIICVFADGFYGVLSEDDVGLESAGDHLGERFGEVFRTLWAIGLLASGQVATIGLTYAGQLVMSGLLNFQVKAGPRMLVTRLVALIPTVTLAVVFEASHTFDSVAQTLNMVQALVLPFALIPVIHVAADKKLLGAFSSPTWITIFAGAIATVVTAVNGWTLVDFYQTELGTDNAGVTAGFCIFMIAYFSLILYFALGPENVPTLINKSRAVVNKGVAWMKANTRCRADFESMLEVHH